MTEAGRENVGGIVGSSEMGRSCEIDTSCFSGRYSVGRDDGNIVGLDVRALRRTSGFGLESIYSGLTCAAHDSVRCM